jgi:DHA2 family multidrug resistance protein
MFYMAKHLHTGIDFHTAVKLRAYQSVGLAFLFVPINTLVFAGMPPQKSNAISGIVNLSRNMGGDIGIAFVTTFVARRSQFHQSRLASHTSLYDPTFAAAVKSAAHTFTRLGAASADATHRGLALLYRQLQQQAATLAYLDAIKALALATAAMLVLLPFTRRPPAGAAPGGH